MTLERRLSKLEGLISLEARPGTGKVILVRREHGEDPDAAIDRHLVAHPEDEGAKVVIVHLRKMLAGYDDEGV